MCDPNERVTFTAGDRANGSGVLRYLAPGLSPALDDLAWLMIIVSDNAATQLLREAIGEADAVNATMAELGLTTVLFNPRFSHRNNVSEEPFGTSTPRISPRYIRISVHAPARCSSASSSRMGCPAVCRMRTSR